MCPKPELQALPPLPAVGEGAPSGTESTELQPIPALEARPLPKIKPSVSSPFRPKTITPEPTKEDRVRKITSPFKLRTAPTTIAPPPKIEIPPSPESATEEPAQKDTSEPAITLPPKVTPPAPPVKMTMPDTPLPPPIKEDAVDDMAATKRIRTKQAMTGPTQTRTMPTPVVPPEVLLRNTVRRTLAEQGTGSSPFRDLRPWDRLRWTVRALITGRTFDEVAFEKTRRFRVDEVYLLRKESLTLISYASNDAIRHVYPKKVDYDLRRLRVEVQEAITASVTDFTLPAGRQAILRHGRHTHMVAVISGIRHECLEADLGYTHNRIEHQFGRQLRDEVSNFTFPLQPLLEDCLLIQSPLAPS